MPEPTQEAPPTQTQSSGGGMRQFISEHRAGVIAGIIATVIVAYVLFKNQSSSTTTAAPGNQQGSLGATGADTSGIAYALTQLTQQLNNLTAVASVPGPTGPPGTQGPPGSPGGTGGPPPAHTLAALLPIGTKISIGGGGREWYTEPGWKTGKLLVSPSGVGALLPKGTILAQGGQGRYWYTEPGQYGQALIPTNPQAAHSPIRSWLPLVRGANENVDLSNYTITGNPGITTVPPPGVRKVA